MQTNDESAWDATASHEPLAQTGERPMTDDQTADDEARQRSPKRSHSRQQQGKGRSLTLAEISILLDCEPIGDVDGDLAFSAVVASDAMSEILASTHHGALMLTGLTTIQSVRTAIVADVPTVIYLRGKRPSDKVLDLARDKRIHVMLTDYGMFESCGILYAAGLEGEI